MITAHELAAMAQPATLARATADIDAITPPAVTPERAATWFVLAWRRPSIGRQTPDELDVWRRWVQRLGFVDGSAFPPKLGRTANPPAVLYRVAPPHRARGASWAVDPKDALPYLDAPRSVFLAQAWHMYTTSPAPTAAWATLGHEWAIDPGELRDVTDLGPVDPYLLLARLDAA